MRFPMAFLTLVVISGAGMPSVARASTEPWTGNWHTYWRDGEALVTFEQSDDRVMGTYEPGGGKLEGRTISEELHGRWWAGPPRGEPSQ